MLAKPQAEFVRRTRCINCDGTNLKQLSRGRYTEEPLAGFITDDPSGEDRIPYLQEAEWSFVECGDCQQRFHQLVLNDEWEERSHTQWMTAEAMQEFERRRGILAASPQFDGGRNRITHILRIEKLTRPIRKNDDPVRLLDFGCGWGRFVAACTQFGFKAVGIDRAGSRNSKAHCPILSSIDDVAGQTYHAISLFEVLEHLHAPSDILRRLSRLLVPGGILILETPDCAGVTGIKTYHDYCMIHPLGHINAFTHETLTSIASRLGFRPIARGSAHVTADRIRVIKREARHLLGRDARSTQLYFRKG